ncbi:MAG: thiazole synthase [Betaproteobacteria bacterium]|nr:thiazole synthase [Betaproteobacteria bacterium]
MAEEFQIGGVRLRSRLMLGTARYPSPASLSASIAAAKPAAITVSLRRSGPDGGSFHNLLAEAGCPLLPNTAGCRSAAEAVACAHMCRELLGTDWIKLEVIGDDDTLQPEPFGLVDAARQLVDEGFVVFAYTTEDLVVARRLHEVGCAAIMPWGSMIGSGCGIEHPDRLRSLRSRLPEAVLIVDAGIGRPSDAAQAMELGMDAVLLNSAVAGADDPPAMAQAFAEAVAAGRRAWRAGMIPRLGMAQASTPALDVPFWQEAD